MSLGIPELSIIFLIVIVLFGAAKLPQLGRGLGEGIKNFRRGIKGETTIPTPGTTQSSVRS